MGDPGRAAPRSRSTDSFSTAGDVLLALVPGVLTLYLSLRDGGFFPGTTALAAAEVALCVAVVLVIARRPWGGLGIPLGVAIAAIAGLAAWTLASSDWSDTAVRAMLEYTRVLLYALTLVLFGLLPFSRRRVRWMVYGLAAAAVAVCGVALVARTLPEVLFDEGLVYGDRLSYPLGYWNALAFMAGLGTVLCAHLTCSTRNHAVVRVLGAAAVPMLAATLYYTLSRGGTWAAGGALVVYLLVARPRGMVSAVLATTPPVVLMLLTIDPSSALTEPVWGTPETVAAGEDAALAIGLSIVAAAGLRTLLLPLDGFVRDVTLPRRARRPAMVAATAAAVCVALVTAAAFDVPDVVSAKYAEFNEQSAPGTVGTGRLLSASGNGRQEHWDVALDAFRRDPFHGSGAGMYNSDWTREREHSGSVQDAHSLYVELLGELGWPGLALGLVAVLMVLGGFAFRARGRDRALFAALLAAGLAWTVQASVDWLWEMPAVTLWLFALGGAALAAKRRSGTELPRWTIGVRAAGVALCLALMLLPTRVAVSQARLDSGLDAVRQGRCDRAREDARSALSALPERASPHHLIAFCDYQEGRPRRAVRAMAEAVERDPGSWRLNYGLAVSRAAAGQDPRVPLARALRLNPREKLLLEAARAFRGKASAGWRRRGARLALPAPGPPVP